jgi:hypothetical protein
LSRWGRRSRRLLCSRHPGRGHENRGKQERMLCHARKTAAAHASSARNDHGFGFRPCGNGSAKNVPPAASARLTPPVEQRPRSRKA